MCNKRLQTCNSSVKFSKISTSIMISTIKELTASLQELTATSKQNEGDQPIVSPQPISLANLRVSAEVAEYVEKSTQYERSTRNISRGTY